MVSEFAAFNCESTPPLIQSTVLIKFKEFFLKDLLKLIPNGVSRYSIANASYLHVSFDVLPVSSNFDSMAGLTLMNLSFILTFCTVGQF